MNRTLFTSSNRNTIASVRYSVTIFINTDHESYGVHYPKSLQLFNHYAIITLISSTDVIVTKQRALETIPPLRLERHVESHPILCTPRRSATDHRQAHNLPRQGAPVYRPHVVVDVRPLPHRLQSYRPAVGAHP